MHGRTTIKILSLVWLHIASPCYIPVTKYKANQQCLAKTVCLMKLCGTFACTEHRILSISVMCVSGIRKPKIPTETWLSKATQLAVISQYNNIMFFKLCYNLSILWVCWIGSGTTWAVRTAWITGFVSGQKCLNTTAVGDITAEVVSSVYSIKLHFKTFSSLRNQRCLVSLHAPKALKCNSGSLEGSSVGVLVTRRYEKCQNFSLKIQRFCMHADGI
jgi:hypothetical protein